MTSNEQLLQTSEFLTEAQQPDLVAILEAGIHSDPQHADILRTALQAENIGRMNPELRTVIDTLVGIKIVEVQEKSLTPRSAEQIFVDAIAGDESARSIAEAGLVAAHSHDQKARALQSQKNDEYRKSIGRTDEEVERLRQPEQLSYAPLSLVHATDHEPIIHHTDGRLHIDNRYSASRGSIPRSTVHVALNHVVESHYTSSNWDDKRVIVVAPMQPTVDINGDPSALIGHDTWWETAPQEGLVLPDETIIIKPGTSRAVPEVMADGHEIRYKNNGVTGEDVLALIEAANDYELSLLAQPLAVKLAPAQYDRHSKALLGTSLPMYERVLEPQDREIIKQKLYDVVRKDPKRGDQLYANLAKRVAVRMALRQLGQDVIEPKTIMEANFMSPEIDKDINRLANQKAFHGHHSESRVGKLEKTVLGMVREGEMPDPEKVAWLKEMIAEDIDQLSLATLHMYYRLGLL